MATALKNQIFLKVVRGLIGQKLVRSVSATGDCTYRGINGCKCAAGHLIPDKDYNPNMEGNSVSCSIHNPISAYFVNKYKSREIIKLIRDCQYAHDTAEGLATSKSVWAARMLEIYDSYKINSPTAKIMLETVLAVAE